MSRRDRPIGRSGSVHGDGPDIGGAGGSDGTGGSIGILPRQVPLAELVKLVHGSQQAVLRGGHHAVGITTGDGS